MESFEYLHRKKIKRDERVDFLVAQVGDVKPRRDSLFTSISHVSFFFKEVHLVISLYNAG